MAIITLLRISVGDRCAKTQSYLIYDDLIPFNTLWFFLLLFVSLEKTPT